MAATATATAAAVLRFTFTFSISVFLLATFIPAGKSEHNFAREVSKQEIGLGRQKLSHLHFYFHDIVSGRNPTAVRVAEAAATHSSPTSFGLVRMIDDPLTAGPEMSSKIVGRAQGIYASADLHDIGFLMAINYVFIEGKFNGSTLSILGRNAVLSAVREMPVVGGSGLFRFARGYAQARTHTLDLKTGDAVVEYNVFVFHLSKFI